VHCLGHRHVSYVALKTNSKDQGTAVINITILQSIPPSVSHSSNLWQHGPFKSATYSLPLQEGLINAVPRLNSTRHWANGELTQSVTQQLVPQVIKVTAKL
jgi:hypothetical protein